MEYKRIGLVITGSFCTLSRTIRLARELVSAGYEVLPILSFNVASLDTRFYKAVDFRRDIEEITGHKVIDRIEDAEPIGPKNMCDIMLILPCTGNTLAKIAHGITDTPATMAVKSHIRNNKKVLVALASNDGLGASFDNIATLYNTKNFYFVPFAQDSFDTKPKSLVYIEGRVMDSLAAAIGGIQLPIIEVHPH